MTPDYEYAHEDSDAEKQKHFWALLIGCIGVVYGDIGTSPLYAFREAVHAVSGHGVQDIEIFGILSLIIWALLIVVTFKYVVFLLRADNRGEGGILSLMALAQKALGTNSRIVFFAGITGAALFYGDAAITPAISVLSAVEGLKLASPAFGSFILPLSILILMVLFAAQKSGTNRVSILFGPVTAIWFFVLAVTGLVWIAQYPYVLLSFSPFYAGQFLIQHGMLSFLVLGAVFLAVTGAEALYADLGHFGRKPIQRAWLFFVFPALVLNYLGQGALVLLQPEAIENPFYLLVPEWGLLPMVGLATAASIIASQAVITGAFSLTRQATQLGLLPRLEIRHTSETHEGQIYMPRVNNLLLLCVLLLCVIFRTSSGLASAYGIAVTGTMVVTTVLAFIVVAKVWRMGLVKAAVLTLPFLVIECVFLSANLMKVFEGGFVPLLFAVFCIVMMSTWVAGTRYLYKKAQWRSVSLLDLIEKLDRNPPHTVQGTAIFLTSDPEVAPEALTQNLRHNQILHERNVILTVTTAHIPKVPETQRLVVKPLSSKFLLIIVNFGFMEIPDIPKALKSARMYSGIDVDVENASFFLGRRKIIPDPRVGLPHWQDNLYAAMAHSAVAATDFYRLPRDQVVELGVQMAV